ncbi:MAG: B12-binding domain-containing radical SAM protein [Treponema sp.]|nr:B12-binding domain-containing radical SAM protein [Treponema sp.]
MKKIVLTAINAKWIHPSLALRLLKANLGALEESCEIMEFALRQPLAEKTEPLLIAKPFILGISVSIWNHLAVIELLKELDKIWINEKPIIILGGPEVSHLPEDAEIFQYAGYVIRGEGETAFRLLCEKLLKGEKEPNKFITAEDVNVNEIKTAYHLYTDEDVTKKLIYVESSRGCVFNCEFCLSAVKASNSEQIIENSEQVKPNKVREFPIEPFLAEMEILIKRGVRTFKFLDRSFNTNINRALQIIEFFLSKINNSSSHSFPSASSVSPCLCVNSSPMNSSAPPCVHFEMVPSLFPPELLEALARFPPGTLRLEVGIQTLNPKTAALIGRPAKPEKELEALRLLREKTNAIIHADLIAGLPGEDFTSFGKGFDQLWTTLGGKNKKIDSDLFEIQLGILKFLPGTPISRHNETYKMQYNPLPPYEIEENSLISTNDLQKIKNFARFWELIINRELIKLTEKPVFDKFMEFSEELMVYFGRNWGIDKEILQKKAIEKIETGHFS